MSGATHGRVDPDRIGRYVIEGVLGRGAMGVIYRAHDPEIDRRIALKLIRADLLDSEDRADYIARFRREAQAAGRCMHPNIVTIFDFALHEGNPFLAMEFVDGVNLGEARDRGAVFAPADSVFVILQVLAALGAMHALGVVHRDIKPANILLVGGTTVKVTDFGISRLGASELTQDGSVIGTPSYMSPEQCRGEQADARSDLFSTGAILYELLCGERPFAGRNFQEVMHRLLFEAPPDIRGRSAAVSPALAAVVHRALAKPAGERFASAADMAASLHAAMQASPGLVDSSIMDRTIVVPAAPPPGSRPAAALPATGMTGVFPQETLGSLERSLARHVGPIARHLVQSAIRKAANVEALCASLAGNIEEPGARDAFRTAALLQLGHAMPSSSRSGIAPTGTPASALPDAELEFARKELAQFLGPVARVLVKRSSASATSVADLWERLAGQLDSEADRARFLSRRRP